MSTDPLDIAFIALGAAEVWRAEEFPYQKFNGGYVDFIAAAVEYAPMCSAAFRVLPDGEFTGTWAYSVALPFGRWIGRELVDGRTPEASHDDVLAQIIEAAR